MTRVLITNDDGIDAPGLRRLALTAAEAELDVVVAAPIQEASGSSAAMTAVAQKGRVVVQERRLPELSIPAYAVAGSPAFIALIATRGAFGPRPDLVLSGINRGANAGRAVLHSGTVGAAMTGAANGCRAMAVSLDLRPAVLGAARTGDDTGPAPAADGRTPGGYSPDGEKNRWWDTAGRFTGRLIPLLLTLPDATVLNLNVPDLPAGQVRGLRQATLSTFGQVQMAIVEKGAGFVRTSVEEAAAEPAAGTDAALLAQDYATVTALRLPSEAAVPGLDEILHTGLDDGPAGQAAAGGRQHPAR